MTTVPTKRKRTLVDSEVQGSLLRRIVMHWLLFFVCNALALMIWIRMFEQPDADWGHTFSDALRRFLPFFVITAALIPAFVLDTLKLSNRFAGPIMRLRSALKDAKDGRAVPPLVFREGDFWKEIAASFNGLMQRQGAQLAEAAQESNRDDSDEQSTPS